MMSYTSTTYFGNVKFLISLLELNVFQHGQTLTPTVKYTAKLIACMNNYWKHYSVAIYRQLIV